MSYDPPRDADGEIYAKEHIAFFTRSEPSNVLPTNLLGLLITTGVWPAERVLAHVERLGVPSDRGEALVAVAPYLPNHLLGRTLNLARTVTWDGARAETLAGLGPQLPEDLLGEAWGIADAIPDPALRATTLTALARHLPGEGNETAFQAVLAAARATAPATQLTRLLPGLPVELRSALLREAFPLTELQRWEWERLPGELIVESYDAVPPNVRVTLLAHVARLLPPGLLIRAWHEAAAEPSSGTRAEAMAALAPLLPATHRGTALQDAWAAACAIPPPSDKVLARLAGHLPVGQREEAYRLAITAAEERRFPRDRPSALTELVPLLPEELRATVVRKALDAVVTVQRVGWRAFDVCRLGPYLPAALIPEALTAILTVECEQWRAEGLAHIAQHLPPDLLDPPFAHGVSVV